MPSKIPVLSIEKITNINLLLESESIDYEQVSHYVGIKFSRWKNQSWNQRQSIIQKTVVLALKCFSRFEKSEILSFDESRLKERQAYHDEYKRYQKFVNNIDKIVQTIPQINAELNEQFHRLKCLEVAWRYNIGMIESSVEADGDCFESLKAMALQWKLAPEQELCLRKNVLNDLELQQLREVAKYPEWVDQLKECHQYKHEMFNWVLRDYNQPEVFVRFNRLQRKVKKALIAGDLGYARALEDEFFKITRVAKESFPGVFTLEVTAPFYDGAFTHFERDKQFRVNMLDPNNPICFRRGNECLTVKKFFKEGAKRNDTEINYTLAAHWGYVNFHPVRGVWNEGKKSFEPFNETAETWLENVPPRRIARTQELSDKFSHLGFTQDMESFFQVRVTRQRNDLTALKCHGYWLLYHKIQGTDQWRLLSPGVFAETFQRGPLDGVKRFCGTEHRVVARSDQNPGYAMRQKGSKTYFEDPKELENEIYQIIKNEGVFQFTGHNCAHAVQTSVQAVVPATKDVNFFRIVVTKCRSGIGPIDWLFNIANRRQIWVRNLIIHIVHRLFFSWRKVTISDVSYSVANYFKDTKDIYNPAYLIHQTLEAQSKNDFASPFIDAEVLWGNTEERIKI